MRFYKYKSYQSFRHLYFRGALLCVYTMYLKLNCPQIKRVLLIYTDSKLFYAAAKKYSESLSFVFLLCRYTLCRCTAVHLYNYAYVQLYVLNWHFTIVCFFYLFISTWNYKYKRDQNWNHKISLCCFEPLHLCTFYKKNKGMKTWSFTPFLNIYN